MMKANKFIFDIRIEPRGETYRRVIDLALHFCDQALLVIRTNISLSPYGAQTLKFLEPFLLRKMAKATQWPGTVLHYNDLFPDNTATVYYYRLCSESARILKDAVEGLYSWKQPECPEDLCLLRSDGSPWLVTITHEEDSYLELTPKEKDRLLADVPELDWVER